MYLAALKSPTSSWSFLHHNSCADGRRHLAPFRMTACRAIPADISSFLRGPRNEWECGWFCWVHDVMSPGLGRRVGDGCWSVGTRRGVEDRSRRGNVGVLGLWGARIGGEARWGHTSSSNSRTIATLPGSTVIRLYSMFSIHHQGRYLSSLFILLHSAPRNTPAPYSYIHRLVIQLTNYQYILHLPHSPPKRMIPHSILLLNFPTDLSSSSTKSPALPSWY